MRKRKFAALCTSIALAASYVPQVAVQAYAAPVSGSVVAGDTELPEKFDLRTKGLVTPVGDQGPYETSWAFSALASIESGEIAHDPMINLSEWHLSYYTYCSSFGYTYTTDLPFDASTYDAQQEAGILTSWIGPVREDDAPMYGDMGILASTPTMEEVRSQADYHTTAAINYDYFVPNGITDEDKAEAEAAFAAQCKALKTAIAGGHAIDMSYYESEDFYNETYASYLYNGESGTEASWHSVAIVGWDDAFPADHFNAKASADGAWLCKDSRGVSRGDNGYFWISYYDPTIGDLYEIHAEPAGVHNRLYQHDAFGNSGAYSYGEEGDTSVMIANEFVAENDGFVTSAMFCNLIAGDEVEITVYTDLEDANNPVSGKASGSVKVVLPQTGYQTIDLPQAVAVKKGERFSVAAKLSGKEAADRIPCEYASQTVDHHIDGSSDIYEGLFTMEMLNRDFSTGQSFFSADGSVWYDMYNVQPKEYEIAVDIPLEYKPEEDATEESAETLPPAANDTAPTEEPTEAATEEATQEPTEEATQEPSEEATQEPTEALGESSHTTRKVGNICLKAVTVDSGTVTFSDYHKTIPADQAISLLNYDQAPIYYSTDGVNFELYNQPITFPEGKDTMQISAYADVSILGGSDDKKIYTQTYTKRHAVLSSLLCKEDSFSAYADVLDEDKLGYSVSADSKELTLYPTSTGTVKIDGTEVASGDSVKIPLEGKGTKDVTIEVTQEGLTPTSYTLSVRTLPSYDDPQTTDDYTLGDVNADGNINASDAALVLIDAAQAGASDDGASKLTATQQKAADINKNGEITASDAAFILIFSAAYNAGRTDVKIEDFVH
ncbi:MAG: hypothetical protein IKN55_05105 [Oscillospiraceae bacterium]|nr:hypothetical protein [Oscillospiraceae bacterium]